MSLSLARPLHRHSSPTDRLEADAAQAELAARLDRLAPRARRLSAGTAHRAPSPRLIGAKRSEPPRGLYIHGAVGRGKTLLMDLFFEAAPSREEAPRPLSTPSWPTSTRACIAGGRCSSAARSSATIRSRRSPAALAGEATLLCFDEFERARHRRRDDPWRACSRRCSPPGVAVVATSNVAPGDLYKDGLNRALFLPFVALMGEQLERRRAQGPRRFSPGKTRARAGLHLPRRRARGRPRSTRRSSSLTGASARRADGDRPARPELCAFPGDRRRRALLLRRSLPPPVRRRRLSRPRRALSHPRRRSHPPAFAPASATRPDA